MKPKALYDPSRLPIQPAHHFMGIFLFYDSGSHSGCPKEPLKELKKKKKNPDVWAPVPESEGISLGQASEFFFFSLPDSNV